MGTRIITLRFNRQDEQQADLAGLDYMIAAGYNPYGLVECMEMLAAQNEQRPSGFLSTHPVPENRSAYLKQSIMTKQLCLSNTPIGKEEYAVAVLSRLN
ncbi:MAG: M48 family metalloprotease [Sedimentisphaerales bacterium]|nr:M48 family metalloprotease [Sedimentisphaerales bacterium]